MSKTQATTESWREAGHYEIRFRGHLEQRWAEWFEELTLTRHSDGTTVLRGPVVDQAALHGLLQKVRDLGLPLVSVAPVELVAPDPAAPDPATPDPATPATPATTTRSTL